MIYFDCSNNITYYLLTKLFAEWKQTKSLSFAKKLVKVQRIIFWKKYYKKFFPYWLFLLTIERMKKMPTSSKHHYYFQGMLMTPTRYSLSLSHTHLHTLSLLSLFGNNLQTSPFTITPTQARPPHIHIQKGWVRENNKSVKVSVKGRNVI